MKNNTCDSTSVAEQATNDITTTNSLIEHVGSLWFGDPKLPTTEGGINPAEKTMDKTGVPYSNLNKTQIENWYQFKNLPDDYVGFYQKDGGAIN